MMDNQKKQHNLKDQMQNKLLRSVTASCLCVLLCAAMMVSTTICFFTAEDSVIAGTVNVDYRDSYIVEIMTVDDCESTEENDEPKDLSTESQAGEEEKKELELLALFDNADSSDIEKTEIKTKDEFVRALEENKSYIIRVTGDEDKDSYTRVLLGDVRYVSDCFNGQFIFEIKTQETAELKLKIYRGIPENIGTVQDESSEAEPEPVIISNGGCIDLSASDIEGIVIEEENDNDEDEHLPEEELTEELPEEVIEEVSEESIGSEQMQEESLDASEENQDDILIQEDYAEIDQENNQIEDINIDDFAIEEK